MKRVKLTFISLLILCVFTLPSFAFPWVKNNYSKVRLLGMHDRDVNQSGTYTVGVYLKMEEGWKTYWRIPGDSGIPPIFDWSGSKNVKSAEVLWPAPHRFVDPYGISIGYDDEVLFPIKVEALNPSRPVALNVTFQYGVCKDICVPEQASVASQFDKNMITTSRDRKLLQKFVASVPQKTTLSAQKETLSPSMPKIKNVTAVLDGKTPHLLIESVFAKEAQEHDLFLEASDNFYMAWPEKVEEQNKTSTGAYQKYIYRVDLTKGDKPENLKGRTLTMTLVSDKGQSEVRWVVQ